MSLDLIQQIEEYLSDEAKLYQDWYLGISPPKTDSDTKFVAVKPSLESMKKRFDAWFKQNCGFIKDAFCKPANSKSVQTCCEKWKKWREKKTFHTRQHLIVAIVTDIALSPLVHPSHTVVTVTLLFANGYLDLLCIDCDKECPEE